MSENQKQETAEAGTWKSVLAFCAVVVGCLTAAAVGLGSAFMHGTKVASIDPEVVTKHADKIIDPNVDAKQLETLGFYKQNYSGLYLEKCRNQALAANFNGAQDSAAKARQVSDCIKSEIIMLNTRATSFRRYN